MYFKMTQPANKLPDDIVGLKGIIAEQILNLQKYEADIKHHREEVALKNVQIERLKVLIPYRTPIGCRPSQVDQRIRFGHWEGDTMEGLRIEKPALNVLVERKSRMLQLTKLPDRTARSTRKTIVERLRAIPPKARRSVTYDNGHENAQHYKGHL